MSVSPLRSFVYFDNPSLGLCLTQSSGCQNDYRGCAKVFGLAGALNRHFVKFFYPLLLIGFWQLFPSPRSQSNIIAPYIFAGHSIDFINRVVSFDQENNRCQIVVTHLIPRAMIDDSDGGLDDWSADTSTRSYQDTPLFSVTGLDAVTLRTPRIVPILLYPVHCFYCLHEHIRERAPPCRAEALA